MYTEYTYSCGAVVLHVQRGLCKREHRQLCPVLQLFPANLPSRTLLGGMCLSKTVLLRITDLPGLQDGSMWHETGTSGTM